VIVEVENFEIAIQDNITTVKRNWDSISWKGELKHNTRIRKSKNTKDDIYDKRTGIVVAILKSLGFSRRVISKIANILLEENKNK
jgi:hypothetical protein